MKANYSDKKESREQIEIKAILSDMLEHYPEEKNEGIAVVDFLYGFHAEIIIGYEAEVSEPDADATNTKKLRYIKIYNVLTHKLTPAIAVNKGMLTKEIYSKEFAYRLNMLMSVSTYKDDEGNTKPMTKDVLCDVLDIIKGTYARYERGDALPSIYVASNIAALLHCPTEFLIGPYTFLHFDPLADVENE